MATYDRCILCNGNVIGMGHNPEPLAHYDDGRACDECNDTKVIPARLGLLIEKMPPPIPHRIGKWVMMLYTGDDVSTDKMLASYDPDAHDGGGAATWTDDPDEAMHFEDAMSVLMFWRQQSKVRPLRDDGEPNRPLTTFTVEPRRLDG